MNSSTPKSDEPTGQRLQKVLAAAGFGSRRACEALIEEGRVSVNGEQVVGQGRRVDPATDIVRVDGERIKAPDGSRCVMLHKPVGVVTSMSDEQGRPDVSQYVAAGEHLFHVGRLDTDTSGLLLLTNDGDLTHRLTHPSFGVSKTYVAQVAGQVTTGTVNRLRQGVVIEDRPVEVERIRLRGQQSGRTIVELDIHEGRNRIVRRLFDEVGHPVKQLVRIRFGPISLGDLPVGQRRDLTAAQVASLYDSADLSVP